MKNLLARFGKLRLVSGLLALGLISAGVVTLFASKAALKLASEPQRVTPATQKDKRPNRLIEEKSPYLLQHTYNPVDWFPWGEEAF